MDSQIWVYLFNKILLGNKRKQTADIPKNRILQVHVE